VNTGAISPPDARSLAGVRGIPRLALVFVAALSAAGVVTNENSYFAAALVAILCLRPKLAIYTRFRRSLLIVTASLILFGTLKGIGEGNALNHVLRFTLPFTAFLLFACFPGLGLAIARSRRELLVIGLLLTMWFFYIVKTGNWLMADDYMPGWTPTYSSNASVGVWIYFMLPVCFAAIFGSAYRNRGLMSLFQTVGGLAILLMLILMNDTSAYFLAIGAITAVFVFPRKSTKVVFFLVVAMISVFMVDFLTSKLLSRALVSTMMSAGMDDVGDMLRLIQIEYFVELSEPLGSGFGARHNFPLMISVARQQAQMEFPYASELPILNMIYNGGMFAAAWFVMVFWACFRLVRAEGARGDAEFAELRLFGLSAAGVLIGSISNPFLFAPASMLLLVIIVDLGDAIGSGNAPSDTIAGTKYRPEIRTHLADRVAGNG
jgi:hypothetical protein